MCIYIFNHNGGVMNLDKEIATLLCSRETIAHENVSSPTIQKGSSLHVKGKSAL